jgi:hypothetical protein
MSAASGSAWQFSFMFARSVLASPFSAFGQNLLNWALASFHRQQLFNHVMFGYLIGGRSTVLAISARHRTNGAELLVFSGAVLRPSKGCVCLIWFAAAFALCFGAMLDPGSSGAKVIDGARPDPSIANSAASFLWLDLQPAALSRPGFRLAGDKPPFDRHRAPSSSAVVAALHGPDTPCLM